VDTNEARQLLLAERERLTTMLNDQAAAVADQQDFDPSTADLAKDLIDREVDRSQFEWVKRELAEVDSALQRVEDGTYGVSEISGRPIPDERLRAVPHARTRVDEQELIEGQARAVDPNNPERRT
jgi:RNA polymerase-binding transcription factor DksA